MKKLPKKRDYRMAGGELNRALYVRACLAALTPAERKLATTRHAYQYPVLTLNFTPFADMRARYLANVPNAGVLAGTARI